MQRGLWMAVVVAVGVVTGVGCQKEAAPTATPTTAPTGTTAPKGAEPMTMEPGIDRAGEDYRDFDLDQEKPELCRDACFADAACKAYTYVKAGVQGDKARCWLKQTVPGASQNDCCVSGVRR